MTENSQSEDDWATQLKDIGKKYMRWISLSVDSVIKDLESKPRAKRSTRPKQVAKPAPRPQKSGVLRWLFKGPEEEREDSSA